MRFTKLLLFSLYDNLINTTKCYGQTGGRTLALLIYSPILFQNATASFKAYFITQYAYIDTTKTNW